MMRIFLTLLSIYVLATDGAQKLKLQYSWKSVDYAYPNEASRQQALLSKQFIPENNLPVGIEVWEDKLFVTVPRWKDGVPSTLNYINRSEPQGSSPKLIPYPSWEQNKLGNCATGLSTVYRIKTDSCGRLWVLDTGTFGIEETTTNPCPYAINVFDLNTNKRIRRYEFLRSDTNAQTFIANIAVDIGSSCEDAFAYFSDELGYGLIVYDWKKNTSWRFEHGFMFPDPLQGDFNIGGENFQWFKEGIFGMAISPKRTDGFRTLYFSPLASLTEFSISTKILRNSSRVGDSYHEFQVVGSRGPNSHVCAQVMSDNGVILYDFIEQNAIGCWNSRLPYNPSNHGIADKDDVTLIYPSDVKIDQKENVWVISDLMPTFLMFTMNYNQTNYRIFSAPLSEMLKGTVCEVKTHSY